MHKDVKEILYTQEEITQKCKELGKTIMNDYHDKDLVMVGLLKGSVPFLAELSKFVNLDVTFDYMDVSSYEGVESRTITIKRIWIKMSMENIFCWLKIFLILVKLYQQ